MAQTALVRSPQVRLDATSRAALAVWAPVALAGAVTLAGAIARLATERIGWHDLVGIALLIAAATLAEAFPVPIEGVAVGSTSLATIFLVAGATIYGWAAAAVAGFLVMALVELGRRRPFSRIAFNCGVYVLAGAAAGGVADRFQDGTLLGLALGAIGAAIAFYAVDITLLAAVVTRSRGAPFARTLTSYVQLTFVPFAVMASLAVILVVLWDRSPFVAVVLVGPLLATALYQRWIHGALNRLREFDRLKDEFIAIVSHELRTPLTSVYGAAMTLEKHELDEERKHALLEIISTEAARLSRADQPDRERRQVLTGWTDRGSARQPLRERPLQRPRRGPRHPDGPAGTDLREVLSPRSEHGARGRGDGPRSLHLPRARRRDERRHLGRVGARRGSDVQLRAAGRPSLLIPL
jgi:hypothetical protein